MPHKTFNWRTPDRIEIFAQMWLPKEEPKAIVCLIHGHGEHSSRYEHVAKLFNQNGIGVYTFDLPGHGRSGGKRGYIAKYDHLLDYVSDLLRKVKERYGEIPVFLYGHSMGGNLVARHALQRNPEVAGIILTSPWLRLAFQPSGFDIGLAKVMNVLYPKLTQNSKLDASFISRVQEEVDRYTSDPMVHDKIGPPLFLGCVESGEWSIEHAAELKLPLLHMHGTADKITSFEASKEFAERATGDVTFVPWEGLYHETHHEPEREEVLGTILKWMKKRI